LQKAWVEVDVPQCVTQAGQLMTAAALLAKPKPTDDQTNPAMTGVTPMRHLSRIRAVIQLAANPAGRA
jgi:aerobic-type carbon monoxide dehydrogenase small subunit (CoxS/CutS family)